MEQNPYAPSQVSPVVHASSQGDVVITPAALSAILGTQFWVKLTGFVMFVIVALQLIGLVFGLKQAPRGVAGGAMFVFIIPLIIWVIYVILALRLLQYGKAISSLALSHNPADFERAMDVQCKYCA